MKGGMLPISLISLGLCTSFFSSANEETLQEYWPFHAAQRSWDLIDNSDKDLPESKTKMSVLNKNLGPTEFELWFFNKPGQAVGSSDVERYAYCGNSRGPPWLFLETYINAEQGKRLRFHPVQSTRIRFTPHNKQTLDLMADGTYARCGNTGQPYLLWNQDLDSYRIQVWGYLNENPKWKWYWDATVTEPEAITNNCLKPAQTVRAIKVQEAWWNNFKAAAGTWDLGTGDMGGDGLPAGTNVNYGRTVWHAQGQLPYFLIGRPDGRTVGQCVKRVMPVVQSSE
jgi:hypothetical protein